MENPTARANILFIKQPRSTSFPGSQEGRGYLLLLLFLTTLSPHLSCPSSRQPAVSTGTAPSASSFPLLTAQNVLLSARQISCCPPCSLSLMALLMISSKGHLICEEWKFQCWCIISYYLLFLNCVLGRRKA